MASQVGCQARVLHSEFTCPYSLGCTRNACIRTVGACALRDSASGMSMVTWHACSFSLAVTCCFRASAWVCLEIATMPATLCSKAFSCGLFAAFCTDSSSSFVIPLSRAGTNRPDVRCRWCEATGLPCKDAEAPRAGSGGPDQALIALGGDCGQWTPDNQRVAGSGGPDTHFAWHLVHMVRRPGRTFETKYSSAPLNFILPRLEHKLNEVLRRVQKASKPRPDQEWFA